MTYYKVKPQYAQMQCNAKFIKNKLVANELYTKTEVKKLTDWEKKEYFTTIDITPKNTYFFFGCRFQRGTGWAKQEVN